MHHGYPVDPYSYFTLRAFRWHKKQFIKVFLYYHKVAAIIKIGNPRVWHERLKMECTFINSRITICVWLFLNQQVPNADFAVLRVLREEMLDFFVQNGIFAFSPGN